MSNQKRFALIGRSFGSDAFDEYVQDLIGALLADSSEIDFTYTDATPTLTAALTGLVARPLEIEHASPRLIIDETDAPANERIYDFASTAGNLEFRTRTDADGTGASWLTVTRTGTTVDSIALAATAITVNGVAVSDFARLSQANTFTGTRQTFSNTNPLLVFVDTDAAANNQKWGLYSNSGAFGLFAWNDAESVLALALNVVRSAAAITSISYGNATDLTVHDFYGAVRSNDEMQLEGGVNSTLSIDKNGALGTKRFGLFVGDGTSSTVADDNYIRNLNTTLHIMGGALGTTEVAALSTTSIALTATAITVNGLDLASGAAVSLLGRSANSAGARADITASANDRLLRRTGDTLNFGQLTSGMFPNTVVPDAALSSNVPLLNASNTFTGGIQTLSASGIELRLISSDATGAYMRFSTSSTARAYFGNGTLVSGGAVTDLAVRVISGSLYISGDDGATAHAIIGAARSTFNHPVNLQGYTVAGLPTGTQGDVAYVTDALAPAFLTAIAGGGAVVTPVFYDGTNWVAI